LVYDLGYRTDRSEKFESANLFHVRCSAVFGCVGSVLTGILSNAEQFVLRLSGTGRSPTQVIGRRLSDSNDRVIVEMKRIASQYQSKSDGVAELQDFLSFRQALNVASADQRLLVFVNADKAAVEKLSPTLKKLFSDKDIIGRFHLDIAGEKDSQWSKVIADAKSEPAINVIRAGEFGLDGTAVNRLSLDASLENLKKDLLAENKKFGEVESRKDYAGHVRAGRRQGIKYETEIPYGEDRDGDGKIDGHGGGKRGGKRGRGRR